MALTIEYDSETKIIKMLYTGELNIAVIRNGATKRIALQKETGAMSVLVDISGINRLNTNVFDLLSIPDKYFPKKGAERMTRMALVLPLNPQFRKDAFFYETSCKNRGWNTKSFDERHEAIAWLIKGEPSDQATGRRA